jgi:hypothetical protein
MTNKNLNTFFFRVSCVECIKLAKDFRCLASNKKTHFHILSFTVQVTAGAMPRPTVSNCYYVKLTKIRSKSNAGVAAM